MAAMTAATVLTDPLTGELVVRFAYDPELVEAIKSSFPRHSRRWSPAEKCWRVDPWHRDEVMALLDDFGLFASPAPRRESSSTLTEAFVAVLDGVPERLHRPLVRAMAGVLHPDHGGDNGVMVALLDARDSVKS